MVLKYHISLARLSSVFPSLSSYWNVQKTNTENLISFHRHSKKVDGLGLWLTKNLEEARAAFLAGFFKE